MKRYLVLLVAALALGMGICAHSLAAGLSSKDPDPIDIQFNTPEPIKKQSLSSMDVDTISIDITTPEPMETHSLSSVDVDPINVEITTPEPIEIHSLSYVAGEDIQLATIAPAEITTYKLESHAVEKLLDVEIQPYYLNFVASLDDSAQARLSQMTDAEIASLVQQQYELIMDLKLAFESIGIQVNIDPYTGMLAIDSSLLYATNEYKVTEQGKAILRTVFNTYCSVLGQDQYRDSVSNVLIVGHTDNAGSYEYNVDLSRRRAEAVMTFCLSPECGVENTEWLAQRVVSEGHSYDELIYNADGTVNMAASRRVEIGFRLAI